MLLADAELSYGPISGVTNIVGLTRWKPLADSSDADWKWQNEIVAGALAGPMCGRVRGRSRHRARPARRRRGRPLSRALPADGSFAVRFHHVAVSVPDGDAEWERIRSLLRAAGFTFDHGVAIPDRMRAAYVDTTSHLGHMIEICQMTAATRAHYLELLGPDSASCR